MQIFMDQIIARKTEAEIRAAHPDWTDGQVAAEVARLAALPPAPPPAPEPEPPKPQDDATNRAMAEMRRRAEAAEAEATRLKDAEAARERAALEEQGEWQRIAEQATADKAALEARIAEGDAKAALATAKSNALTSAATTTTERPAFKDPGYALYLAESQGGREGGAGRARAVPAVAADRTTTATAFGRAAGARNTAARRRDDARAAEGDGSGRRPKARARRRPRRSCRTVVPVRPNAGERFT